MMCLNLQARVVKAVRQCEQLGAEPSRHVRLASAGAEHPLSPQRRKEIRALLKLVTQHLGLGIGVEYFRGPETTHSDVGSPKSNVELDFEFGAVAFVGDIFDRGEGAPEVDDRLLVGAAPQGLGGRTLVVRDRARKLITALEMLGEFGCEDVKSAAPGSLQPATNTRVTEGPSRHGKPVIKKLAVEVVAEGVKLGKRSVRPSLHTRLDDEHALARQSGARQFDNLAVALHCRGRSSGRELRADHTRG